MKNLLKSLIVRHRILESRIEEEQKVPMPDSLRVRALKKMRLHLRDQIAWLERMGVNAQPLMRTRRRAIRISANRQPT